MRQRSQWSSLVVLVVAALAGGCGGDSGSSDPFGPGGAPAVSSTATFPLSTVRANLVNRGYSFECKISGTMAGLPATGEETIELSVPEAVTFEGQAGALKNSLTEVGSITIAGRPQGISTLLALIVSSNYAPLGAIAGSGEYWVVTQSSPEQSEAKVGDLLNKTVYTVYANAQKILTKGRVEVGGSIDADIGSTAIFNSVWTTYNIANTVIRTEAFRYRIDTNGNVRLASKSLVENNASNDSIICR